ncbi:MAG TPA: hypothetical protein DDY13_08690 [Cytophagales bacterium]|nr:hypothetical protein [Cytophagales bacterium]
MEYELINTFLSSHDAYQEKYKLVNPFIDGPCSIEEYRLTDPERWHDARTSVENSDFTDPPDFTIMFTDREMKKIINRICRTKSKRIAKERIEVPISFIDREERKSGERYIQFAFPTIFNTKNNETIGFLYSEIFESLESASGTIYVYKRIGNEWKLIYRYGMWISG